MQYDNGPCPGSAIAKIRVDGGGVIVKYLDKQYKITANDKESSV